MYKSVVACLFLFSGFAYASVENKEFSADGLKSLVVENTSGEVRVSVSSDGKVYVAADKIEFEKNCTLTVDKSGKELIAKVEQKGWFNSDSCKVNFEIKVPKTVALDLKSGSGDLFVTGTKGKVDVKVGSGDIKVDADVDQLDGKSGSGSIEVTGLLGNAAVKTGSGTVTLSYKSAPSKGELDIKTGSGNATVFFPSTTKVMTDFKAGSGKVYNELGDTSDASFRISMKAGSGNLKIKKLQ
ncbi:MAG: DUF4097 domain-containing protein [Bdellovibrionales bacterium]|nr:DUF4097 domain-containing protein [Bdellovibrionales bacterium]